MYIYMYVYDISSLRVSVSLVSFFTAAHVGSTSVSHKFQRIAFLCVAYSRLYK